MNARCFVPVVHLLLFVFQQIAHAAFPNAWQITDSAGSVNSIASYRTNLSAAQAGAATNLGFRFTVNVRLGEDFGSAESLGFAYSTGANRFAVLLDHDVNGNLLAICPTNGGTALLALTTNALGARAYHTHEIVYSNSTQLAVYLCDGVPRLTWSGDGSAGAVGQASWGAMSDAGQGRMNFTSVRIQINNTNVATYDAGNSTTNRPVSPDPVSRGWTFSGLGPATATNAVSPDTFWNPAVVLNGPNPITIPWTQPFVEPGAIVTASPVSLEGGRFLSLALKADGTVAGWGASGSAVPPTLSNVVMLAAGDAHNLALLADRTVVAWGDNSAGQTEIPAGATNVIGIAAGQNHSVALRGDGTVVQWGDDLAITNPPATATNVVAVAAGMTFNVALRSNGTVVAWGYGPSGQTNVPSSATNIVGISSGNHTLALRSNGTVLAWGNNAFFQTNVPSSASNVIAVAAGLSHSLALRSNGTVVAWGAGTNNTGISPSFGQAMVPSAATNIIAIAAGDYHSLALRADGVVIAWGAGVNNSGSPHFGQAMVPTDLSAINSSVSITGGVSVNVPGSYVLTYALTNGYGAVGVTSRTVVVNQTFESHLSGLSNSVATLTAFANPAGVPSLTWFEWGLGSRFDQATPQLDVGGGSAAMPVAANLSGLVPGLPYRARLVTSNSFGLVARGIETSFTTPLVGLGGPNPLTNLWGMPYIDPGILATGAPVALAAGRVHSLALKADGYVAGWGDNSDSKTNPPAYVNDGVALAAGQNHGVLARADGSVTAWGNNAAGQLNVPVGTASIVSVAAGESFSLGLRNDGAVVGWGDDFYGTASGGSNLPPSRAVAAGQRHVLALSPFGEVSAYGYNGFGQANVPSEATNIVAVAGGGGHSLALRADRTVFVWGLNSYFQTNLPVSATNVIAIAAGFYHSLALRADGTVVAWGAGTNNTGAAPHFGQSIVPASATNVIAIAAGYYHSLAQRADGSVIAWGAGTTSTGAFPGFGQALVPGGLNMLDLAPTINGIVTTTQEGEYPLSYTGVNSFGGVGGPVTRTVHVTTAPGPSTITALRQLGDGTFEFNFTNGTPASFTVLATTNLGLPTSAWTVLGPAVQVSPGMYQFTDAQATNSPLRFYQVRSP